MHIMRRLQPVVLFVFFMFSTISASQSRKVFEHKLAHFAEKAETCSTRLKIVASEFAEKAQVRVVGSECFVDTFSNNVFVGNIRYEAEKPLQIYSLVRDGATGIDAKGRFSDRATCERALSVQEEIFRVGTELNPFAGYCFKEDSTFDSSFGVNFEAVGVPIRPFAMTGADIYGFPEGGYQNLVEQITSRIQELSLVLSGVYIVSESFWKRLRIGLYSTAPIRLHASSDVRFESSHVCVDHLKESEQVFYDFSPNILRLYCESGNGVSGNRLTILSFTHNFSTSDLFVHRVVQDSLNSRSDCEVKLPMIQDRLESEGYDVLAIFCGKEHSKPKFSVHAYIVK